MWANTMSDEINIAAANIFIFSPRGPREQICLSSKSEWCWSCYDNICDVNWSKEMNREFIELVIIELHSNDDASLTTHKSW